MSLVPFNGSVSNPLQSDLNGNTKQITNLATLSVNAINGQLGATAAISVNSSLVVASGKTITAAQNLTLAPGATGSLVITGVGATASPYAYVLGIDSTTGLVKYQAASSGPSGATGATGSPGPSGATGATGSPGTNGATGATGSPGTSGATGATGSPGADGATGATGSPGADGATGATGSPGADGATGATGSPGSDGATGATGSPGSPGTNGATGATGSPGTNGATGATGPSGAISAPVPVAGTTVNVVGVVPGPATTISKNAGATGTLVITQTITLDSTNWNYATGRPLGILGNISMAIAGDNGLLWTATYQKNAGGATALAGCSYYSSLNYFTTTINGITRQSGGTYDTFATGDTITLKFYVQALTTGTAPTVEISPLLLSAVFSALNV